MSELCWCRLMVGFVTHADGQTCPTREHWLDVEDSETEEHANGEDD